MDFKFTKEQELLRDEFDEFFREEMKHAPKEWGAGGFEAMYHSDEGFAFHQVMKKKLAAKGWISTGLAQGIRRSGCVHHRADDFQHGARLLSGPRELTASGWPCLPPPSWWEEPKSRRPNSFPPLPGVRFSTARAGANRMPDRILPTSGPRPSRTETTMSLTARRPGPPAATARIICFFWPGLIRIPPGAAAFPSST